MSFCRESWNEIDNSLFDKDVCRNILESLLVKLGFFSDVVKAIELNSAEDINKIKLKMLLDKEISQYKGIRNIVIKWLSPIISQSKPLKKHGDFNKSLSEAKKKKEEKKYEFLNKNPVNDHDAFQAVSKQIDGIKKALTQYKMPQARKYTEQLVSQQVRNNDSTYAAKSLCNISSYAIDVYQKSFSLELNLRAVELAPEDGWAWCALADSYISLRQFSDASNALDKALSKGEGFYAAYAKIRILQLEDKTEDAIAAYTELLELYTDHENAWHIYLGLGNAYREREEYEQSEECFINGIRLFPQNSEIVCALAKLYLSVGRLDESLELYRQACGFSTRSIVSYLGVGDVYKEKADYKNSHDAYKEAQKNYPDNIDSYKRIASILRLQRRPKKSLSIYDTMKEKFPYDYSGFVEKAYALSELKKFNKAKKEFVEAEEKYNIDIGFRIKYAKLLKEIGSFKSSLQMFSQICNDYPNNLRAKLGQADLLKELGKFDDAIKFYDNINDKKHSLSIAISKAAIFVNEGRYSDVSTLLPNIIPKTKAEWVAYHIQGMAFLKQGDLKAAISKFKHGIENVPFFTQRQYFHTALAVAQLKDKRFDSAIETIKNIDSPITNVIKLHAFCGSNRFKEAKAVYREMHNVEQNNIVSLRDELGSHFGLNKHDQTRTGSWIHEQECNLLTIDVSLAA